jgi:hypothetical protein
MLSIRKVKLEDEKQSSRKNRILLTVLWLVSILAFFFVIAFLINTFFISPGNLVSLDWAGYGVASDFANPQPVVVGVNSSWTVPTVSVSPQNTYSAAWIGIGGQLDSDSTLIQVGTEHDCIGGVPTYSIWYETLPGPSFILTKNVASGDKITACINLVNLAADEWSIEITDLTTAQSFEENVTYQSSRFSAEWIVERPTIGNILGSLADFGTITFANSHATFNNTGGTISSFPHVRTIMDNRQNTRLVAVSSLVSGGSSFSVSYLNNA